jgi:hypothetical protein
MYWGTVVDLTNNGERDVQRYGPGALIEVQTQRPFTTGGLVWVRDSTRYPLVLDEPDSPTPMFTTPSPRLLAQHQVHRFVTNTGWTDDLSPVGIKSAILVIRYVGGEVRLDVTKQLKSTFEYVEGLNTKKRKEQEESERQRKEQERLMFGPDGN